MRVCMYVPIVAKLSIPYSTLDHLQTKLTSLEGIVHV